jgi:L-ascorbate metabolism protein UlaG (beta-lactamase superfamily)
MRLARNRRGFLRALIAGTGVAPGLITALAGDRPAPAAVGAADVALRWFGVNGWEIAFDDTRVLIDPWLTRFPTSGPAGTFDESTPLWVDRTMLDHHVQQVDLILVTHGHFDHIADVPYLLSRFPDARVVGTETHVRLLTAMGADERQTIWVRGGEVLAFAGFTVEVVPSLHSLDADHRYLFPGTVVPAGRPRRIGDLVEGGTLAYQVTVADRLSVFNTGAANLIDRAVTGLRPDVAILSFTEAPGTHRYLERALALLGGPRYVVPSHHDDLSMALDQAPTIDAALLHRFVDTVTATSPGSTVLCPRPLDRLFL